MLSLNDVHIDSFMLHHVKTGTTELVVFVTCLASVFCFKFVHDIKALRNWEIDTLKLLPSVMLCAL